MQRNEKSLYNDIEKDIAEVKEEIDSLKNDFDKIKDIINSDSGKEKSDGTD